VPFLESGTALAFISATPRFLNQSVRMFQIRNLALLLGLVGASNAFGQSLPLNLQPGDILIADTAQHSGSNAVRIIRSNGAVDTVMFGSPLDLLGGIQLDRDGAVLVSSWQGQWHPDNAIFRLDPAGGVVTHLNNTPLKDNFAMVRDSNGDLVVADGYGGLARINGNGDVDWYSPSPAEEIAMGVDLDFDGNVLLASPPSLGNTTTPGSITSVDPSGSRTVVVQDPLILHSPNDLALAPDGSLIATNFRQYINPFEPKLVHVAQNGTITALAHGGLLQKPKGVHISDRGQILVADTDEQAVLSYGPVMGMQHVAWDLSDGIADGTPVDRPFDVDQVPTLWLRSEYKARVGVPTEVRVSAIPDYWGKPIVLAVSRQHGATAMNSIWPGSVRISHLDLSNPQLVPGNLPVNGSDWTFSGVIPPVMAGSALHLQVALPSEGMLSNYIALPVR